MYVQGTRGAISLGGSKRRRRRSSRIHEHFRPQTAAQADASRTWHLRGQGLDAKQFVAPHMPYSCAVLTGLLAVIPDYAKMTCVVPSLDSFFPLKTGGLRWYVRAPTRAEVAVAVKRVTACFELACFPAPPFISSLFTL